MVYLLALLIFVGLSGVCWAVSTALTQSTLGVSEPPQSSQATPLMAIMATALTSFIPFPGGYIAGLIVWAVAAFAGMGLSMNRAAVLFLYLSVTSFVARLAVLGVLAWSSD